MPEPVDSIVLSRPRREPDPHAGAIALAAFNGAAIGIAGCIGDLLAHDGGAACVAALGTLLCAAVWERQLLGADGSERT